jgi:hypothetical protein
LLLIFLSSVEAAVEVTLTAVAAVAVQVDI